MTVRTAAAAITASFCLLITTLSAMGQQGPPSPAPSPDDEIIRITTDLVQSDVTVLDQSGKPVHGLSPESFRILYNGKPRAILAAEQINSGTAAEEAAIRRARGLEIKGDTTAPLLDRSRIFIFFIDDRHLSAQGVPRAVRAIRSFLDHQLAQNDRAAIFTSTGQLHLLEQFTDERDLLYAGLDKLVPRAENLTVSGGEMTPMTEAQARAILGGDRQVINYFIDRYLKETQGLPSRVRARAGANPVRRTTTESPEMRAESQVKARAEATMAQVGAVAANTIRSLLNVVRIGSNLPGRKVLFFLSEGFLTTSLAGSESQDLQRVGQAALRSGTVIFPLNLKGVSTNIAPAESRMAFDPGASLSAVDSSSLSSFNEPLEVLANSSGGRLMLDSNAPEGQFGSIRQETETYYLIAWKPEAGDDLKRLPRDLSATVSGHPDWHVRIGSGGFELLNETRPDTNKQRSKTEPDRSQAALSLPFSQSDFPIAATTSFASESNGIVLTTSIEFPELTRANAEQQEKAQASIDISGMIVNADGSVAGRFEEDVTIEAGPGDAPSRKIYNKQIPVKPGLYQVRVAAMDRRTRRVGTDFQWIRVPDPQKAGFTLSSLFLGEIPKSASAGGQLSPVGSRRFSRDATFGFLFYAYNAGAAADLGLQVQIFRAGEPVLSFPIVKIETGGQDPNRIAYGDTISLATLVPGKYLLKVSVIDRTGKRSALQQRDFIVD